MVHIIEALAFFNCISLIIGEHHLVHVHLLFRHGDRSSITPYVFSGYDPYKFWPDGLGQLTQEGIEQHFLLGKFLRARYGNFSPKDYNVSNFRMRSSDIDRSLMSAQACMAGFFYHSNSSLSKYGLHWRPIPTHTVPTTTDTLLAFEPCPRMNQRRDELLKSKVSNDLIKQHKPTMELLSNFYGITNLTLDDVLKIRDDLFCLKSHNLTVPEWYTEEVAKELDLVTDKLFQILFTDQELLKLAVGIFLGEAFSRMEDYIHQNSANSSLLEGILAYSAHDTNVAPLLGALGAYTDESKPAYASLVAIELFSPSNTSSYDHYLLRLFYKRGWTDPTGSYIHFGACRDRGAKEGCPFEVVRQSIAALILLPEDIETACTTNWLPAKYRLIVIITLTTFLVLLLFTLLAVYRVTWNQHRWCRCHSGTDFEVGGQLPYSPLLSSAPTA